LMAKAPAAWLLRHHSDADEVVLHLSEEEGTMTTFCRLGRPDRRNHGTAVQYGRARSGSSV